MNIYVHLHKYAFYFQSPSHDTQMATLTDDKISVVTSSSTSPHDTKMANLCYNVVSPPGTTGRRHTIDLVPSPNTTAPHSMTLLPSPNATDPHAMELVSPPNTTDTHTVTLVSPPNITEPLNMTLMAPASTSSIPTCATSIHITQPTSSCISRTPQSHAVATLSATSHSKVISAQITATKQPMALCSNINQNHVVPVSRLKLPEYCFEIKTDFDAKRTDKNKPRATLCLEQLAIVGLVLSGQLNTCGGILILLSMRRVSSKVMDDWRNNLNTKLQFIPKWIYNRCISMHIVKRKGVLANLTHTRDIMMCVKKSPRTITYDSHMYVRSPDGSSHLADSDTVICVLQTCAPATCSPHHSTCVFSKTPILNYNEELPPESMYIEYKHWKVTTITELINKVKTTRNTKGLFSLANNISGGYYVIGVDDETCRVQGLVLSHAEQEQFRVRLARWMKVNDAGTKRIWGCETHEPCEGSDKDWEVTYIPVHNCPDCTSRCLIVIHVHHCVGGMFERVPECYQIDDAGDVTCFSFEQWKHRIISESNRDEYCSSVIHTSTPSTSQTSTVYRRSTTTIPNPLLTVKHQLPCPIEQSLHPSQKSSDINNSPSASTKSAEADASHQSHDVISHIPPVTSESHFVAQQTASVAPESHVFTTQSPITYQSHAVSQQSHVVAPQAPAAIQQSYTESQQSPDLSQQLPTKSQQSLTENQQSPDLADQSHESHQSPVIAQKSHSVDQESATSMAATSQQNFPDVISSGISSKHEGDHFIIHTLSGSRYY